MTEEEIKKLKARRAEAEELEKYSQAIRVLTDGVNRISPEKMAEYMMDGVSREHRTLQQNFFKAFQIFLKLYSEGRYDGRNEASVAWAKEVVEKVQSGGLPLI